MGTLFDQQPRDRHGKGGTEFEAKIEELKELAKVHGVEFRDVVALYAAMERERTNDLYRSNGDIFDEHMAGMGELIRQLVQAVEDLRPDDL